MRPPLEGVRVLAFEQYGAGPFGTLYLADLGAEVIKIENPRDGGDMSRAVGPHFFAPGDSQFFHTFNRNKRSLTLDLAAPEARAVLHDLVRSADAIACNLRGDVPRKLGLTHEQLKGHNPRIVCAFLSAYGREGPRAAWPGFDFLMQAEAGYFALTGEPGGPPARCGLSIVDLMSGLAMAYALVSALLAARKSGIGRDIDVSLFDVALFNVSYLATWYLNTGFRQDRLPRSAHPSLTPCQLYRTADGWIYIMCNKEKFWPALCRALEHPEWADDARFRTFADRLANRAQVNDMVETQLVRRATGEWLAAFGGSVPAAPVLDVAQALENPFVTTHGRIADVAHAPADGGHYRALASPIRSDGEIVAPLPAPALGADTEAILTALGYDGERIAQLKAARAI
jgi:crotonobetainyl-CoA:carnitine CoA-transferase CaiB-like acyl-CoA transferase